MNIDFNTLQAINFDNHDVQKLIYNGITLWEKSGGVTPAQSGTVYMYASGGWEDGAAGKYWSLNPSGTYAYSNVTGDLDSRTYGRFSLPDTKNYAAEGYLLFDTSVLNSIPANATINSVTWRIKYNVNNATYMSSIGLRLWDSNNNQGVGTTIFNKTTTVTTTDSTNGGSWTRNDLSGMKLRLYGVHNNSTNWAYLLIYAVEVKIDYS